MVRVRRARTEWVQAARLGQAPQSVVENLILITSAWRLSTASVQLMLHPRQLLIPLQVLPEGTVLLRQALVSGAEDKPGEGLWARELQHSRRGWKPLPVGAHPLRHQGAGLAKAARHTASTARMPVAATATVIFAQPYVAPRPRPCDQGGASWQLFEKSGQVYYL